MARTKLSKRAREDEEAESVDGKNNPETTLASITTYQTEKRRALFQNSKHADVIFKCPDPQSAANTFMEVFGHKRVLANASNVFDKMFYGSLPSQDKVIEVPDVEAPTFLLLFK